MKILMSSYVFSPSVGGIETVSELLAPEFVRAGHELVLITRTRMDDGVKRPYEVVRCPGRKRLFELLRWCDVYFQNNISLILAWPLLFVRKPWIIAHHTWLGDSPTRRNWKARLKRFLLARGLNATISRPIAADLPIPSTIVGNPYSTEIFRKRPEIPRTRELVYLGRLVRDKGVDLLIESLVELRERGLTPRLTIIGSGSEESGLRTLIRKLGLEEQVTFLGSKRPEDIALQLNAHQVLAVPSRWPEPFGIVVLEGIACGCVVAASDAGGLPEAVGPCGITFHHGERPGLTETLYDLLTDSALRKRLQVGGERHLQQFKPEVVAEKYLNVFKRGLQSGQKL